ncbi:Hypothetical_protein [Hexamita inflata]|uniref:Hypothetical_protein n=1 Tax=Hexamita inflata TaxID=28002 RepID=A0AA86VCV8_9EUKA|nr:Hypothetical protein HINF_LOCUS50733 [Hexamita inflata]
MLFMINILNACANSEIVVNNSCKQCYPPSFPNANKTSCVSNCKYQNEYLDPSGTFCVENCLPYKSVPIDNICVQCYYYIAANGLECADSCLENQIINNFQCKNCNEGLIPDVYKVNCIQQSTCSHLSIDRTFCVQSCETIQAKQYLDTNLCFECSYYDKLAVFGSSQCQCGTGFGVSGVFPNCGCLSGFVQVGQLCQCYGTISSDGQTCTQRCESPFNIVGCSSCEFGNSKTQFFKDCSTQVCSSSIFMQNGLKYVFCLKGNQGSKLFTQNVVLQSLSKFRGGLLFGAKQLTQVKISSQLTSSSNIDQFSLNLVSEKLTICQSIVYCTIQNSLTNLAAIQKFGSNIKLQYSEINITFSSVTLMCFGIGSQVLNLQINQLLFNLTCLDRSYYTNGLAMNMTSPVINSLQLSIQIPNAVSSSVCDGLSQAISNLWLQNSVIQLFVSTNSYVSGISEYIQNVSTINNLKLSGDVQSYSYYGLINEVQAESSVLIQTLVYELQVTATANNCAFISISYGQWEITGLIFVGFTGTPLAPSNPIVGQCDCASGQIKSQGLCYALVMGT